MTRYRHTCLRLFLGLLLGALASFQPLSAQLDPKLQASKTDFLNLYQASTTTKVKPEILTVLDFSGSMSYLMFHPLYVNNDSADNGGTSAMSFSLSGGNKYTIKATAAAKSTVWASLDATVGGGTSNSQNGGTHSGYTMSNVTTAATSFSPGVNYTFFASVTSGTTKTVNWTVTGGTIVSSSNTQMIWKAPALAPYVATATISGGTVGTLNSSKLIRPNGDIVTESDAALGSWAGGSAEIMNWVQSASHARFQYTDGSTLRTVDIPMPWKITNIDSTGHPLSSQTVLDPLTKNGLPYGSGNQIEMDQNFSDSFSGSGTSTTLQTNHVNYKTAYIDWLFTGKYANGPYLGKYIVFDAEDATLAGGQGLNTWGRGYGISSGWGSFSVPQFNLDGSYSGEDTKKNASVNVVPALTRVQAVKRAVIQSWIMFQKDVLWAFRFLDPSGEANSGSATTINNVSTTNATTSGWALLNGSSVTNMNYIAARPPSGNTPLTYAMSRSLAQFTDPSSVFNSQYSTSNPASQCMRHYLILFTDGLDNNGSGTNNTKGDTPYLVTDAATSKITIDAAAGNKTILGTPSLVDRNGTNWNLFTFAGLGAHMADPSLGAVNTYYKSAVLPAPSSGTPSAFLPYAIKARNGVTFSNDHRVTTMTVGVSLGGKYTDASSPKRSLFLAAALGDPTLVYCKDLALITPFVWEPDPKDPLNPDVGRKKANTIFFFDGVSPDALTDSLSNALKAAVGDLTTNATSNPNLPFVGASFGKQIYTGTFQPPKTGGAVWGGDVLMFGTAEVNGQTIITDQVGNKATVLDGSTARWSAKDALYNARLWSARRLYTRIPGGTTLKPFTDVGTDYTDSTTGLQKFVATGLPRVTSSDLATLQAVVQFAAGGETVKGPFDPSTGRPKVNRTNIMGDVINSAPAALEYQWTDIQSSLGSYPRLAAVVAKNPLADHRFRLIMVGTNQGWVHAFGEVTTKTVVTVNGVDQEIVTGDVEELWAFMPTDFLANLDYITVQGNGHRFMADGTPALYHLDMPPSGGGSGNGVVDSTERAIAIFGLRKGGRSYYALDIHNPFTPSLKWSLVPDEASNTLVKNMGFSTSTPAFGRISSSNIIRDAVFLGGGYSNLETEAKFGGTKLGRSVFALDVNTGEILASANLTDSTIGGSTVGSVPAGVIPFEFILNSGMAQRAYFLDYSGGLWSWGSKSVGSVAPYVKVRQDTSDITAWSIRKVSQDGNVDKGARYTTLPAPFRVGSFPGVGKPGSATPAAVGVAMVSGDRNNPLDELYDATTDIIPVRHRLTVVFDRQDSRAWDKDTAAGPDSGIKDIDLIDFTGNAVSSTPATACADALFKYITPGCADYYLAPAVGDPKFGYFINFPKIDKGFVPKGINPPIVVANGLYYSYFSPKTADPCTGGSGDTNSWYTADVMNPIVSDSRSTIIRPSGQIDTWAGVASDYIALGTRGVLQGGAVKVANPQPGASLTTPELHSYKTGESQKFPKPRVWRTVH